MGFLLRRNLAFIALGVGRELFCSRRGKMKKSVVGMLALTAMAAAMGSAFAQDADKAAPALTAAEKE